jgi:hypothetical protein
MGSGGACAPARRGALPAQNDLPRPGSPSTSRDPAVDQGAGVFEAMVHDLRAVLRLAQGRPPQCSTAAVLDRRTLRSTPRAAAVAVTTAPSAR